MSERVPPKQESKDATDTGKLFDPEAFVRGAWPSDESDFREATLQVDLQSIKVHFVRRVQFECEEHEVRRYRTEKKDYKF